LPNTGQDRWPRHGDPQRRLAVCPTCERDFVFPLHWEELNDSEWWLVLRCGGCDTVLDLVAFNLEVDAFCRELERAFARLEIGAERLRRERLEAEIDLFATALALDLISSDDFAR
jgi:hypothetical protein